MYILSAQKIINTVSQLLIHWKNRIVFALFVFIQLIVAEVIHENSYSPETEASTALANKFYTLNTRNGLSNDFVNFTVKDRDGFLWIGTQNGLNRYDGTHIKQFFHDPKNPNSVCGNFITYLTVDHKNRLWIGTAEDGVSIYDIDSQKFTHFKPDSLSTKTLRNNNGITCIYEDKKHNIWIATWGSGLYKFIEKTQELEQFNTERPRSEALYKTKIKCITEDAKGNYWLGIWAEGNKKQTGIMQFYPDQKRAINYYATLDSTQQNNLSKDDYAVLKFVHHLSFDAQGNMWVSGFLGLAKIDIKNHIIKSYTQNNSNPKFKLNSRTIRFTKIYKDQILIAGINGGIQIISLNNDEITGSIEADESENALGNNDVKHIDIDSKGTAFVSTIGGGLNISESAKQEYEFYPIKAQNDKGKLAPVNLFSSYSFNYNYLIGGHNYLAIADARKGEITKDFSSQLNNLEVKRIIPGLEPNKLWILTAHNVKEFNLANETLNAINIGETPGEKNKVENFKSLVEWNKDTVYFIQEYGGVFRYCKQNPNLFNYKFTSPNLGFYTCGLKLDEAHLLVGYQNGVIKLNVYSEKIEHMYFNNFPKTKIKKFGSNSIMRDKKGRIWVANDSGIALLHYPNKGYTQYSISIKNELQSFYTIQEDDLGNFWLNSDYYLFHFNTQTHTFSEMKSMKIKSSHDCSNQTYFDAATGIYACACSGGLYLINTKLFYNEQKLNKIVFSDLEFKNTEQQSKQAIHKTTELNLPYNSNNFSVYLSSLDFEKNKYFNMVYQLEGADDKWIPVEKDYKLTFSNLKPGNYKLMVKYENLPLNHQTQATLNLKISPPYWSTWWFIGLCIISGFQLIFLYINNKTKKLNQKNVELEKMVNEKTADLQLEIKKSDELLLNILPRDIALELKQNGSAAAKQHNNVTVLFTDFVNFTGISEKLNPTDLVKEIDRCFKSFDLIIEKYKIEKIKTIGDAYLAAAGLPSADPNHAINVVNAAIEIIDFMKTNNPKFEIRIGIHSGPVVAGIVGIKKFAYDIWGDTVNVASRMESNSEAMKINLSEATYHLIKNEFTCVHRGRIIVKNRGEMDMYFVQH